MLITAFSNITKIKYCFLDIVQMTNRLFVRFFIFYGFFINQKYLVWQTYVARYP